MRLLYGALLFLGLASGAFAQTHTVRGLVFDATNGEPLPGATVRLQGTTQGTATDYEGQFALRLARDTATLVISFVGFTPQTTFLTLRQDTVLRVGLAPVQLDEVVVTDSRLVDKLRDTQMSTVRLSTREAKMLPALFGEVDLLKTLQLKPGIQAAGEGFSGLYVRGGGPDQNLMLLDGVQIYNANHLFGLFSVFNSDAVEGIDLYKGGFPARYGGRLSSVVDVGLREGNAQRFSGSGGLGLISSRLTLEGPIVSDKASFIVSARRTYFDVFTRAINRANDDNPEYSPIPDYYFYDLNAKLNFVLSPKDRLTISGYYGQDVFGFSRDLFAVDFRWGNAAVVANWNHRFNNRLSANYQYAYTQYDYEIVNQFDVFRFGLGSGVADQQAAATFDYVPNDKHLVQFGGSYIYHDFDIGRANARSETDDFTFSAGQSRYATEYGLFVSDKVEITNRWNAEAGLRWSGFLNNGTFYQALEPRLATRYLIDERTSIKGSYARMNQYVHLVSSSGASLPTDLWYPSSASVTPQISDQVAAGVSYLFGDGRFLITNEVYYKWLDQQIDFRDGADLLVNDNLEQEFVFGTGRSYGNELYLEKKEGKTTGWIGYTLSWSDRQFAEINDGRRFFPRYDRRHDVSVVVMHRFSPRVTVSGTWIFGTGNAFSVPPGKFLWQGIEGTNSQTLPFSIVPVYQERNNFRLAPYHRMDLSLVWRFNPRWGDSDLTFSIYNVYNRLNPFFVYFDEVRANPDNSGPITGVRARQASLFPIIPSVTYNFKF